MRQLLITSLCGNIFLYISKISIFSLHDFYVLIGESCFVLPWNVNSVLFKMGSVLMVPTVVVWHW